MVRQRRRDLANKLVIGQDNPKTKFERWIQFNAGDNIYFSMRARATKPYQVTSEQLVQTFVIAKLLSARATVAVNPPTALDLTCNGCDLFNVLLSSSGMFKFSPGRLCRCSSAVRKSVSVDLHLPAFLTDDCDMAFARCLLKCATVVVNLRPAVWLLQAQMFAFQTVPTSCVAKQ